MPRIREGHEGAYFEVPADVAAGLRALAEANGRTISAEAVSAFRRHIACPPVVLLVEGPGLPAEEVRRPRQAPRRRGRPPRKGA